jgi:hypothetical protein
MLKRGREENVSVANIAAPGQPPGHCPLMRPAIGTPRSPSGPGSSSRRPVLVAARVNKAACAAYTQTDSLNDPRGGAVEAA